eukprot:CAMPEP_0119104736 /NCGR_PEP_ID=MMETSP1180-20130426/2880_1 /TAXON_ID=3052 ORGANISM="Chlamydomonas cf sp, Strain CCMP681" /NCGR_SAMPLE_ID=MMETSP1180 /ASSEMBLY_ACC=CAM_ASM_000741 /LENGTH=49 /DNA_ID=CAMNT_0007089569 /DNA_START=293 /DNA_END=442 /DNA_ORIENTATION=+
MGACILTQTHVCTSVPPSATPICLSQALAWTAQQQPCPEMEHKNQTYVF